MTRADWTRAELRALFDLPFIGLVLRAAEVHSAHQAAGEVQLCTLLSIKTGGCPEDCGYCAQSAGARTGLKAEKLMDVDAALTRWRRQERLQHRPFVIGQIAWQNQPGSRMMRASGIGPHR